MTNIERTVATRLADLNAAAAAVIAYQQQGRAGAVEAMRSITPGRSGEALLALAVLLAIRSAG
jgi:hypothetical protein